MPFLPFPFAAYEFVVRIQGQRAMMFLLECTQPMALVRWLCTSP